MTKQEKIKEAYREWWKHVSDFVDEHGWMDKDFFTHSNLIYEDISATIDFVHDSSSNEMIPKEIHGIRDNNGWIKIETKKDLPKENCSCFVIFANGEIDIQRFFSNYKDFGNTPYKYITHYQVVKLQPPPIY